MTDVDFEHSVRALERTWQEYMNSARDDEARHALCRALRLAKLSFFDVDRWYGNNYEVSGLKAVVGQIGKALPQRGSQRYLSSIRRHIREMDRRFLQRDRGSFKRGGIYASSCA